MSGIKYGRAWRKGPTGLETGVGPPDDRQILNIAHGQEEIWELIGFLQRHWPDLFRKWLQYHPESHPVLKTHIQPETISVQWAEKVWKIPSRTRRGHFHNVARVQGRYTCDCEAFMFGKVCWAIQRVIREEATEGR